MNITVQEFLSNFIVDALDKGDKIPVQFAVEEENFQHDTKILLRSVRTRSYVVSVYKNRIVNYCYVRLGKEKTIIVIVLKEEE